jgi:Na+-translocating ferredoxin:NAD+ oxidoreductase RnfE subunit
MGFVRELLGAGAITLGSLSLKIPVISDAAMTIFILPAGGFFVFGFLMVIFNVLVNKAEQRKNHKLKEERAEQ